MTKHASPHADWDPRSDQFLRDPLAAYDRMRGEFSVGYSDLLQWSLFRHQDVLRVLRDHQTFSNAHMWFV